MARILLATPVLEGCLEPLAGHTLIEGEPGADADADALICGPTQSVDATALARMPRLRVIAVAGAGSDAIDHDGAASRGIGVLTSGEALVETTADLAFGLIIAASRLMHDSEARLRAGAWQGWRFVEDFGRDVHGATLGLVGFGSIGQAVARRAGGFGMKVLHHTRRPTGVPGWVRDLDELLPASDVLSIHVPLHESTRGLIDRRRIGLLKPTAVLVNTARGAVGLDVYENEPSVAPRLLGAPHTILLPHIGSATLRTREAMLRAAAEKVAGFLEAERRPG